MVEINWINHFSPASVIMGTYFGMMMGMTILALSQNNPRWWILLIGSNLFGILFFLLIIRDDTESVNYWKSKERKNANE